MAEGTKQRKKRARRPQAEAPSAPEPAPEREPEPADEAAVDPALEPSTSAPAAPSMLGVLTARPVLLVFLVALVVRLAQNGLHPPLAFDTSDMGGYIRRAAAALDEPSSVKDVWATFFPPGTHLLLAGVQAVFGRGRLPVSVAWALVGAGAAAYGAALAERFLRGKPRWLLAVCAALAFDVHAILLGSFVLSEMPFSLALTAGTYHLVRHHDDDRAWHAAAAGLAFAAALLVRPQVSLSLAVLALLVWRSRDRHQALLRHAALFVAPIALAAAFGVARVHHHTGRYGFVSTNGGFNFAFGRCHAATLHAAERGSSFSIPSFLALRSYEEAGTLAPRLDPARGLALRIDGSVADEAAARRLAASCVEASGWLRQVQYSLVHVVLLWGFNLPFPTGGPLPQLGAALHFSWLVPALAALTRLGRRRHARLSLLTAHLAALVLTAAVFYGESRMRVPYGTLGFVVGAVVASEWLEALAAALARRRAAQREAPVSR